MQLKKTLADSHEEYLCEFGLSSIKTTIGNILTMPTRYVKNKVVDSWNLVKEKTQGTEKETQMLEFFNYIFNKNYTSYSQLDYIYGGLEEGLNVQLLVDFYSRHNALVASAAFGCVEVFAQIMGVSSIVLACVYITIALAIFLMENEDEFVEWLKNLKTRVGKYLKFTAAAHAIARGKDIQRYGHGSMALATATVGNKFPQFADAMRKVPRVD